MKQEAKFQMEARKCSCNKIRPTFARPGTRQGRFRITWSLLVLKSFDLIFEKLHQYRRVRLRLQHVRLPFERTVLRVRQYTCERPVRVEHPRRAISPVHDERRYRGGRPPAGRQRLASLVLPHDRAVVGERVCNALSFDHTGIISGINVLTKPGTPTNFRKSLTASLRRSAATAALIRSQSSPVALVALLSITNKWVIERLL
jgi:hypothetical protein